MSDQTLTIEIQAEDAFSATFDSVLRNLERTTAAAKDLSTGFAELESTGKGAADAVVKVQADAAAQQSGSAPDESSQFLADRLLGNLAPGAVQRAYRSYMQWSDNAWKLGADDVAQNLSDATGGLTAGITGGMLAGGVGAGLALLMQNPVMQAEMQKLNAALQELITPLAEAIAPALDALIPLLQELRPAFVLIGEELRLQLGPLVQELRLASAAIHTVEAALKPLSDALVSLKDAIESLGGSMGGGAGGGPHLSIGGVQIFDAGGVVGPDSGPVPADMPGHRLVLAQLGERLVPPGAAAGQGSVFNFHVQAGDPRESAQQIRQVIEELIVTRRLGVA
jgi:hypothetical protein